MDNKPIILQIKETESEIIKLINKSGLPAFFLRYILDRIEKDLVLLENTELATAAQKYSEELERSDKNAGDEKRG